MKRFFLLPAALAAAVVLGVSAAGAAQNGSAGPLAQGISVGNLSSHFAATGAVQPRSLVGVDGVPAKGSYAFLLKLTATPTGVAYYANLPQGRFAARSAAHDQLAAVRAAQSHVISALPRGTKVLYQTHVALAGVGVYTNVKNIRALQRISGVSHVYPIAPKTPSNSYAVPFVHAPEAWQAYSNRGEGTTIAVIDTGIDYTHADFGGPGTTAAYNTAHAAEAAPANPAWFPTAKIPGGYDLVGDAYQAGVNSPQPDTNPLDCNGHGSHTAGTAAGLGENADGTTYTGSYDTSTPFSSMKIGPGMAPAAQIYSYRVFGCTGSTDVVGEAIDMAVDPNGDSNPADHVSVISMSLGASFGSPQDGDSAISNAAVDLGVSVVASIGNSGDVYDVGGSPGNAAKVLAVAASADAYSQIDHLIVDAPAAIAGNYGAERSVGYNWVTQPSGDLVGNVVALTDSTNLDGCAALNAADSALVSGKIAFLEWTDNSAVRRCGSAARAANVVAKGAIGAIFADDQESFAAGITGSSVKPVVMVVKSAGDAIRAQLASGVHVNGTGANDFHLLIPADNDTLAGFTSRGVRGNGNLKPDVSAVGVSVFSVNVGTGNDGLAESGTSMACPQTAGLAALIRSKNPAWSPELVKADVMNTAGQDLWTGQNHTGTRFAPPRVGAGRIDAKAALDNQVLAYVTNDPGAVSASFGPVAATGPTVLTKTIKVDNKGGSSETYDTSYEALTSVPGAVYSVSPSQVTVAGGTSTTVTLTLTIDNTLLTKTKDATLSPSTNREFLAEASGRVLFTPQDSSPQLRVPVYSAPRPASTMSQPAHLDMPAGAIQTTSLPLSGGGVNQGSGSTLVKSLVSGFELQATSGPLPACSVSVLSQCIHASDENSADLKYVGTTSDAPQLSSIGDNPLATNADGQVGKEYFSITTQGPWHTAATQNEYDIYIDTTGDGNPDYVAYNTRSVGGTSPNDVMVTNLLKLSTGALVGQLSTNDRSGNTDTALFDSDTLVMPVRLSALGLTVSNHRFTYAVVTFGSFSGDEVDEAGWDSSGRPSISADALNPGVAAYGSFSSTVNPLLWADMPATSLTLRRDAAAYAADGGQGVLMVHYHNLVGSKAQVVDIDSHSLSVSKTGSGSGNVSSSPAGIDCGSTCSSWFASGSSVTLTATPASGSRFAGWTGDCSGTGACIVSMDAAKSVSATFTTIYTLSVSKSGNGTGSVTSSPAGISCGATCSSSYDTGTLVTLTATPAATSSFTGWSGACSGTGTCDVTMDAAKSVTANFTDLPPTVNSVTVKINHFYLTAKVTFTASDPGNGTTGLHYECTLDGAKKRPTTSCTSPYTYNKVVMGKHTVTVVAIDSVGNRSAPFTVKFTMQ
ncbi:MAG: hypothetical protein QOG85_2064 [Gaiellaceae bacterium]|jgi:subtilisin family serine protease|nr:hypothetical protein [Gaiellaceae bacterium]